MEARQSSFPSYRSSLFPLPSLRFVFCLACLLSGSESGGHMGPECFEGMGGQSYEHISVGWITNCRSTV